MVFLFCACVQFLTSSRGPNRKCTSSAAVGFWMCFFSLACRGRTQTVNTLHSLTLWASFIKLSRNKFACISFIKQFLHKSSLKLKQPIFLFITKFARFFQHVIKCFNLRANIPDDLLNKTTAVLHELKPCVFMFKGIFQFRNNERQAKPTSRLNESFSFWRQSINSPSDGGLARRVSIPSKAHTWESCLFSKVCKCIYTSCFQSIN